MDLILPDKPNVKADLWPHPLTAEQRYTTTVYAAPDTPLVRLLGELLPGVPADEVTVMINGRLVAPGEMALVRVQPDDVLTVRARLQGGDTNPINIILTIAVLALSFYVPGALGLTGFSAGLLSAGITIVGGLIVNALFPVEPPDAPDDGQKPGQQYSISGGANRPRPYEPVLMTLGEHRVFPDLAAVEYVEFIGGEQYLNQVFDFGVGNLDISDLRIGDTPLGSFTRKASASTHTVPHNVRGFGTIYTEWNGYAGAGALADVEQQLALPGEPITLVAGDVDTLAGVPLEDTSPVERTGSERAYQLGFDFVARLVRYNKKGKPRSQSVTVKIEYRIADSSDSWNSKNVTLTGSSAEPVRHTETIEVDTDPSPQQWEVRVSRTTAPSSDTRTVDDVAWTALRTYQVADADATGRTRLALRIRASGQLNSRIARLSGLVRNLAPTWDGSAWSDPAPSSNPADILRWFARGVYTEGRLVGGLGLADARIDHAALEAWRTWCDTNGLTCNLVIDRGMSVVEVMTVIARCGRASLTWQTGKLGVVYNQENRPHSAMVTPANVIAGSFAVDYPDGRLADEIVTRYVDPAFDWQYAELRRLGNGVTAPTRTATVTLQGVTSRDQAKEETNLIAARQLYHKRRLSWEMGPEGQTLPRGDVASVSHDLISGGVTGRCIGGTASVPGLSTDITISENKDYLEFRLADGTLHVTEVQHEDGATATGETDTPTLLTPLPGAPDNGGLAAKADPGVQAEDVLWRFYSGDKTPNRVKIIEVVPQSTERFRFVGIDDVPEYYAAKDLALTDPLPVNRYRFPAVVDMQVSENPIEVGGGFAAEIVVTLTVAGDWRGGVIQAQLNDEAVRTVAALSGGETRASWIEQPSGTLTITAVPGSEVAPTGPALTVTYIIGGDNLAPEEPLNLTSTGLPGGYQVAWDAPTETDYAATEVRDSAPAETDFDNAALRGEATGTQFVRLGLTNTDDLKVWVRHRDHSNNYSDAETVNVTPLVAVKPGDDGSGLEFIFRRTATASAPARPTTNAQQDKTDDHVPTDWSDSPLGINATNPYEWVSVRTGSTGAWGKFSAPVRWSGSPGADGAGVEFIFRRTTSSTSPARPVTNAQQDKTDDHVPTGWTDDPTGTDSTNSYEWVSARTGSKGAWGKFSTPAVWSTWAEGVPGDDGAGLEFIFRRTATASAPARPTTSAQQDKTDDHVPTDWSDSPLGINATNPYEWVSVRTGSTGAWGKFSAPVRWSGSPGADGAGVEFIFRRTTSSTSPARPVTNAQQDKTDDHVPTGWTDDPTGTDSTNSYEWVSARTGSTGAWGKFSTPAVWSTWAEGVAGPPGESAFAQSLAYSRNITSGNPASDGSYKFSNVSTFGGSTTVGNWLQIKTADYLFLFGNRDYLQQLSPGDKVTLHVSANQWAEFEITANLASGNVTRLSLKDSDRSNDTGTSSSTNVGAGNVQFRFSRPPGALGIEEIYAASEGGSITEPSNTDGYRSYTAPWFQTPGAAGYGASKPYLHKSTRQPVGTPAVGAAVADNWVPAYTINQPADAPIQLTLDSAANRNVQVYPGDGYIQFFWDVNSGLRDLDSDIYQVGARIRFREAGTSTWQEDKSGDGNGGSPETLTGLTNDTSYEIEITLAYRVPPNYVLQFGDAHTFSGTPKSNPPDVLAEYRVTAGFWADSDGTPAYTGKFIRNQDIYGGTPPSSDQGALSTLSTHPDTKFAPIGNVVFRRQLVGADDRELLGFFFSVGGGSRGQGAQIVNDNSAFASIQIVSVDDIILLRSNASYNQDDVGSGRIVSSWSWAVDRVAFNPNEQYTVRLLRTPAPEIGQITLAFILGTTLYWSNPNNAIQAGLINFRVRWRASISGAWAVLADQHTPTGVNSLDISSLSGTFEIGIMPRSFQGDGPERIITNSDTGTTKVNFNRDFRRLGKRESNIVYCFTTACTGGQGRTVGHSIWNGRSPAIIWYYVTDGHIIPNTALFLTGSDSRPSFNFGTLYLGYVSNSSLTSTTLTREVTATFTPDQLVHIVITRGRPGSYSVAAAGWAIPLPGAASGRSQVANNSFLRYYRMLVI